AAPLAASQLRRHGPPQLVPAVQARRRLDRSLWRYTYARRLRLAEWRKIAGICSVKRTARLARDRRVRLRPGCLRPQPDRRPLLPVAERSARQFSDQFSLCRRSAHLGRIGPLSSLTKDHRSCEGHIKGTAVKNYAYVVLSNPVPGRDQEYNDWYSNRHLADVVAVPGFVSAQRFRLVDPEAEDAPH